MAGAEYLLDRCLPRRQGLGGLELDLDLIDAVAVACEVGLEGAVRNHHRSIADVTDQPALPLEHADDAITEGPQA